MRVLKHSKRLITFFWCLLAMPAWSQTTAQVSLSTSAEESGLILATMKKVADWELARPAKPKDELDWTYGALYTGITALSQIADDAKYHDAMVALGKRRSWSPGDRVYHADDHCVSQTYLDLYLQDRDSVMIAPTKARFDFILKNQKTNALDIKAGGTDRWSWCDSLFMAPAAWLRLTLATGDKTYYEFMDREWWNTSGYLYDKSEHLYFRDSTYFNKREANGQKIFWSRGNGWVMAGLARVLQVMPPEYPKRKLYEQQFKEMAARIAEIQPAEGLWHPSLLDTNAYPMKEVSGSGFYIYALAWGINRGLLDRATYEPVVRRGWKALAECVTPEGKLEYVQPVGADPKKFDIHHSAVFGSGAFLLAGSEMYRLALSDLPAAAYCTSMPQRTDDFAWENDRIAFRTYGPALEASGEVSSGLDVWVKCNHKPNIEKWYYKANYHKNHGEGLDMYSVGTSGESHTQGESRGCGGSGLLREGKFYFSRNFTSWRIIQNGPNRVIFELNYAPFDVAGILVRETRKFTLETGSNLNRIETRFDWTGGPDELDAVVGIKKHKGGSGPGYKPEEGSMTYWEPHGADGDIGCGVIIDPSAKLLDKKDQAYLQKSVKRGQCLVYYSGACWSKSGDFNGPADWDAYVSKFAQDHK